jgi:CelD/BcsL family acetyltransferase involved in cellulose biosynthesis
LTDRFLVDFITTEEEFKALETEWFELEQAGAVPNVFLTWEWISSWWEHFGAEYSLRVLAARERVAGELVGLAPLMLRRRKVGPIGYRELAFIGTGRAAPDHLDFIVRPGREQDVVPALISQLRAHQREWDILNLAGVSSESQAAALLLDQVPAQWIEVFDTGICPYILLPDSWEVFRNQYIGKNLSRNIERCDRRLLREFPDQVAYRQVQHQDEIGPAMASLFRLHQRVQQANGNAGAFSDPHMERFHLDVAIRFFRRGWLRLYVLTVAGQDISVLYCYRYRDVVSFYQTGYELEWGAYGPGRQIIAHAVRRAIEEGAREFDFLRGDEAYKSKWTRLARNDIYTKIPSTALGRLIVGTRKLRSVLRGKQEVPVKPAIDAV